MTLATFIQLILLLLVANGAPVLATFFFGRPEALLGYAPGFGLVFGALAMSGDLVSSFIKRRRGLRPGARCPVLDQVPEALLPAIYALFSLQIPGWGAIILAISFMLAQMAISRPLYRLRIRKHPH